MIARAIITGNSSEPRYLQRVVCGRHRLIGDEPVDHGGQDGGPAPFDYLLIALGTCTSITLRMYAERKGWDLGTVSVKLKLTREHRANRIEREVSFSAALDEAQRAKLADICERTPVTVAIGQGMAISTSVSP